MTGARVAERVLAWLDRGVYPPHRADPVDTRRGRLLVGLLVTMLAPLPIWSLLQWQNGGGVLAGASLGTAFVLLALLLAYRFWGLRSLVLAALLLLGNVAIAFVMALTGGLLSHATPFLAVLPMLALSLNNWRWGWAVAALEMAIAGGWWVLGASGTLLPEPMVLQNESLLLVMNVLMLVGYTFGITLFLDALATLQQREAQKEQLRAEQANRAKSAFLANMSHELRTPMNGVLGLVDALLHEGGLQESQRASLLTVQESGRALVHLLDDVLDLSKIEANRLEFESVPVNLAAEVHRVVALTREAARAKGLTLEAKVEPEVGWVIGDPVRFRQVLLNLVGNAVKFTSRGGIWVYVRRTGSRVHVEVQDTGIGIAGDALARLFQPFSQADATTTRRFGGTGLGLAISRRLVEAMGGELGVVSYIARGSTFYFSVELPSIEAPIDVPDDRQSEVPSGRTVLVVDDNPVNQAVARRLLERWDLRVEVAHDGRQALAMIREQRPDLVLMDVHMPEMDGLEATRQARAGGYQAPILAMSASVMAEDRAAARDAGMDGFITKPVRSEDLRAALAARLR